MTERLWGGGISFKSPQKEWESVIFQFKEPFLIGQLFGARRPDSGSGRPVEGAAQKPV